MDQEPDETQGAKQPAAPVPLDPRPPMALVRSADRKESMVGLAKWFRRRLPGDDRYGDPLSTSGDEAREAVARRIAQVSPERPSATRELALGALQVWQALSEVQGRGHGEIELTIVFTDLVNFSSWALEAQDESLVKLLRAVAGVVETEFSARGGRVVKHLGDGMMATFADPSEAAHAAVAAQGAVAGLVIDGYSPRMRVGMHTGVPRKLGSDYLGVDVNIAARVAEAAGADEVLVSETTFERLDPQVFSARRRWFFRAKGAPRDLRVHSIAVKS
jgi:adenylate cyclase